MKIVLDTNVLISGMLKSGGAAAQVLRLVLDRSLYIFADERILYEYESVVRRPKFSTIQSDANVILEQIHFLAERVVPGPIKANMPDPDDLPFLEVARAGGADAIVTGNKRHFPAMACGGINVFSPKELLDKLAPSASRSRRASSGGAIRRG